MFRVLLLLAVVSALLVPPGLSQDEGDYHEFTAKSGKTVLAKLLAISEDRRTMKIQREDGLEFESEIVTLSLDDQQYVKDWIKNRPIEEAIAPAADYRLEVSLSRKAFDTKRHRIQSSYSLEQKNYHYEILIRNISRETLTGARVEYVVLWKDAVKISLDSEGNWDANFSRSGRSEWDTIVGELKVETLAFNREAKLATEPYELHQVSYANEVYGEDEFVGIIVRVLSASGALIDEQRFGSLEIETIPWEKAIAPSETLGALPTPRPEEDR